MSVENLQANTGLDPEKDKIDIIPLLQNFLACFLRRWYVPLALIVLCGAAFYLRARVTYDPSYTAQATVSVSSVTGTGQDTATAEQLGKVFPYILTSGALSDVVAEDLGLGYVSGEIQVSNVEGTNLLTITVRGGDAQQTYDVLQAVIRDYPSVSQYVVGQTELTIIDDSGVPADGSKSTVVHGSLKKGIVIGAGLGLLYLILYMLTFRTIRTAADLKQILNAPYLGSLPIYAKKKRRVSEKESFTILEENPQQSYVDALRLIRTRIERTMSTDQLQTLMVTSSIPGEGKSTIAANLAISMARKGRRTILVDADIRSPSQQKIFGVEGSFPGLEQVLTGSATLNEALYSVDGAHQLPLRVLFGSSGGSENVEILGGKRMKQLMDVLKQEAEVIIVDTPPSAMLVDAAYLVHYVDAAVYVVMCDYARTQYVLKGVEELSETNMKLAGCILNCTK